jgi:signal transduction histidine kinase
MPWRVPIGGWSRAGGRRRLSRAGLVLTLAVPLVLATGTLFWLSYRATQESQQATRMAVERRSGEVLVLVIAALERDMKGVQTSVLLPIHHRSLAPDPPYDLADRFARAFAQFPYPESFFTWNAGPKGGETYFFDRSDRQPQWDTSVRTLDPYPVVILRNPAPMLGLIAEARRRAAPDRPFLAFEREISGARYQLVVHQVYNGDDTQASGLVGFTVNLDWVARAYFGDILRQVNRIAGQGAGLSLEILDERGRSVTRVGEAADDGPSRSRSFSLIFFDSALLPLLPRPRLAVRHWTARVSAARDPLLSTVASTARRTQVFAGLAACVVVVALVLTVRAVRASAELTAMKSDFISTVTHELKTPLASIVLVGETLTKGRYTSQGTIRDYARLLSFEAGQLTRLIDNLLTYSRITDAARIYAFEPAEIADLVEEALERFQSRLDELHFEVSLDLPADLPRVRVDRVTMLLVLDNLIDNAIKYASAGRVLTVRARVVDGRMRVEVADRGAGIPEADVSRVFEKFFRGANARQGGSGLGLSIARQILCDHGGDIAVQSATGRGTSVTLTLPLAEDA